MGMVRKNSAFSLIEIMIVVVVMGMMAALVGPNIMKLLFKGKESSTKSTLQVLKSAIVEYQMEIGSFPPKLEALVDKNASNSPKWRGTFIEGQVTVPQDGWGHDFIYNKPPQEYKENYKSYEIISHADDEVGDDKAKWLHIGG